MKKIVIAIILALIPVITIAQNFQGKITYEWKANSEEYKKMIIQPDMAPEMVKFLEAKIKLMFHKVYVLEFNKTNSLYKEERIMTATGDDFVPNNSDDGVKIAYFKNIKTKQFVEQREFYGKYFAIKDSLPVIQWKLESETKKIGDYVCHKATAVVPIKVTREEDEEQKSTNFFQEKEKPTEKLVTAWYTPEIPVSQGPENYWGLPGLILEVNDGNAVTLCTKIVLNVKEKLEIKPQSKGKKVTQEQYDEIVLKKNKELSETETTPN